MHRPLRSFARTGSALAVLALSSAVAAAVDRAVIADLAGALGLDVLSEEIVAYCTERAPAQAPAVRMAWSDWRTRNSVVQLRQFADRLGSSANRLEDMRTTMRQRVAAETAPTQFCAGVIADWQGDGMNVRKLYPRAFEALTAQAPGRPSAAGYPAAVPVRPAGTVYSLAQLTALSSQWRATGDASRAARQAGTLYVRGVVRRWEKGFLIEQDDGEFRATERVFLSFNAEALVGREIVVAGDMKEAPGALFSMQNMSVVSDAGGLTASLLPTEPGLRRVTIAADRLRAAPGRGLPAQDVTLLYHGENRDTGNGLAFEEDVHYLLRDGSLYDRTVLPPEDLDVAASRKLEPQNWHRWRGSRSDHQIQRSDALGKPGEKWSALPGTPKGPWPADTRLEGSYSKSAFYGSLMLGGTYSKNSWIFRRDGRFETSAYRQSGSGGMAADAGFVGSATTHSGASGTRSNVGAGDAGAVVTQQRSRDDGADNRGTYRLEGYVLELRFDNGRSARLLSFPLADDWIYVGSGGYRKGK